jgi:RNA polymerase sigma factor (sigma-70 family)
MDGWYGGPDHSSAVTFLSAVFDAADLNMLSNRRRRQLAGIRSSRHPRVRNAMSDLNERTSTRIHERVQAERNFVDPRGEREAPVEPQTFEELFSDHHDRLYRALYFITGSPDDAEELMQDAFLKLWERWDSIVAIEDPVAWLFRVSMNGFRMRARRARVAAARFVPITSPRDPFEDVNIREDVRQMLRSLPQRQRAALVLTEIFDYSSEQAAQILGIRPTTVRALASQGRAALRAT